VCACACVRVCVRVRAWGARVQTYIYTFINIISATYTVIPSEQSGLQSQHLMYTVHPLSEHKHIYIISDVQSGDCLCCVVLWVY
jgi:hypothetical protein